MDPSAAGAPAPAPPLEVPAVCTLRMLGKLSFAALSGPWQLQLDTLLEARKVAAGGRVPVVQIARVPPHEKTRGSTMDDDDELNDDFFNAIDKVVDQYNSSKGQVGSGETALLVDRRPCMIEQTAGQAFSLPPPPPADAAHIPSEQPSRR